MHRLEHEPATGAQGPADLRESAGISVGAEVADRREEVQRSIEALVGEGQLAVVGSHQARRSAIARASPCLFEQRARTVDGCDLVAGASKRHRDAAIAGRNVEHASRWPTARERDRGERLTLGLRGRHVICVCPKVERVEVRVPFAG